MSAHRVAVAAVVQPPGVKALKIILSVEVILQSWKGVANCVLRVVAIALWRVRLPVEVCQPV